MISFIEMVNPLNILHEIKILLSLMDRGEIKKTYLPEIMESSDSHNGSLHDFINAGVIESETEVIEPMVIPGELIPLG